MSNDNRFIDTFVVNKLTKGVNESICNPTNYELFMDYVSKFVCLSLPITKICDEINNGSKSEVSIVTCINMPIYGSVSSIANVDSFDKNIMPVSTISRSFIINSTEKHDSNEFSNDLTIVFKKNIETFNIPALVSRVTKQENGGISCFHIIVALDAKQNDEGEIEYCLTSLRGHKTLYYPNVNDKCSLIMPTYILPLEVALFTKSCFTQHTIDLAMNQLVSTFNIRVKYINNEKIKKSASKLLGYDFNKRLQSAFNKIVDKAKGVRLNVNNSNDVFGFRLKALVTVIKQHFVYVQLYMIPLRDCILEKEDRDSLMNFELINPSNELMEKFSYNIALMSFKNQILNSLMKWLSDYPKNDDDRLTWNCGLILGNKGMLYAYNLTSDDFDIDDKSHDLLNRSDEKQFVLYMNDKLKSSSEIRNLYQGYREKSLLMLYLQLSFDIYRTFFCSQESINDEDIIFKASSVIARAEDICSEDVTWFEDELYRYDSSLEKLWNKNDVAPIVSEMPDRCGITLANMCANGRRIEDGKKILKYTVSDTLCNRVSKTIEEDTKVCERNFLLTYLLSGSKFDVDAILDNITVTNDSCCSLGGCALIDFVGCCGFDLMKVTNKSIWIDRFGHTFAKVLEAHLQYCSELYKKTNIVISVIRSCGKRIVIYEQLILIMYRAGMKKEEINTVLKSIYNGNLLTVRTHKGITMAFYGDATKGLDAVISLASSWRNKSK